MESIRKTMRDLYHNLKPLGRILDLSDAGYSVWDSSPIRDEQGRVHVFATRWKALENPDMMWVRGSELIHAVADRPDGPYDLRVPVLVGDGSDRAWDSSAFINPKISRIGSHYSLCYTGCRAQRHDTQAIGMLLAESLDGPWHRVSQEPLIAPAPDRSGFDGHTCSGPSLVAHPNGQFWLYYRGRPVTEEHEGARMPGRMTIGVAIADDLRGPYRKHPEPVVQMEEDIEDPHVWHDGERFWMIVSRLGTSEPGGWIFSSEDGLNWSAPEVAYPSPLTFRNLPQRLEKPNLLYTNGRPSHLFTTMGACPEDNAYSGFVFEISKEAS